jgi:hypothetical protein
MSAVGTAIKLAERNGISVPEFLKFLASPAGYTIARALDAIESQANLPQGILSLAQNPSSAATNYIQTQAENAIYGQNEPSRIESIISELQGTNPDKPNYVGPQQEGSTLSQSNTSNLSRDLGVTPSDDFVGSNFSNMNDELREGMFGTITPNFPNFVGPQELNSPADKIDTQFLAQDLGVQPTTSVVSNTSSTADTNSGSSLPSLTPEFLQLILQSPSGVDPDRDAAKEMQRDMTPAFGNVTPESLGFTEVANDFSNFDGGGGGKNDMDYSIMAYKKGGQIYGGQR